MFISASKVISPSGRRRSFVVMFITVLTVRCLSGSFLISELRWRPAFLDFNNWGQECRYQLVASDIDIVGGELNISAVHRIGKGPFWIMVFIILVLYSVPSVNIGVGAETPFR